MKTSTGLALAAALAVAAGAAYTGLPATATPPPPADRPALPPIVLDPGVKLPPPAPADLQPPAAVKLPAAPQKVAPPAEEIRVIVGSAERAGQYFERPAPPAVPPKTELPPLPPVTPGPLPVPQPIVPVAKSDPTKLPAVPPPPLAPPAAPPVQPLPTVPPPPVLAPPPLAPTPKLPAVPPPAPTPLPAPPVLSPLPAPTPLPTVPPRDAPAQANPLPPPTPVTPTVGPSIGSVVVLTDGKIVEGHVSRSGEKVVVRRGVIDQPFPNEQVKYITPDKDAAYRAALADTKADDPAARLRLARWCMYNGMRDNALTEAREAARLEPANRAATELARTLEESLRLYPTAGAARQVTPPAPGLPAVPPPIPAPVVTVPEATLPPEAVVAFGPRVQPVLMNQCAACHAQPTHASRFRLAPVASNEVNPAATRQNLRAAAAQVKAGEPVASPLLVKALAAHGGMPTPAFTDRDAVAFRTLQAWVYLAAGEATPPAAAVPPAPTPALPPPPVGVPAADVRPMLPPPPLPSPEVRPALPPAPPAIPPAIGKALPLPAVPSIPPATSSRPALPPVTPAGGFGQSAPPPAPTGPAQDEFDPANFNRTPRR